MWQIILPNFETCTNTLPAKYNRHVNVLNDSEHYFRGMLIKTNKIRDAFEPIVGFLSIDYKVIAMEMPMYVIICEYSNYQSEIMAAFIWSLK